MDCLECIDKGMADCKKCDKPFDERVELFLKLEEKETTSGFRDNIISLIVALVIVGAVWLMIWNHFSKGEM